jgi:hypothetical protein
MSYSTSNTYNNLIDLIKEHLEICDKAHMAIQKFKKLIFDHLDPSCKDIDLENTPIHLDEIDHHLHPQIQEILTDNFALRQKQYQLFGTINELLFKLVNQFPEITQKELQEHFKENKLSLYMIPVVPSHTVNVLNYSKDQQYVWGNKPMKYQLAVIVTPNKKYLKEAILKYGFDSLEEMSEYLEDAGFISIKDDSE